MSLLRRFSTLKIAGDAEHIFWLSDLLVDGFQFPEGPVRILGNGSNVLMDDRGFKGSVVLTRDEKLSDIQILAEDSTSAKIQVPSGFFLPSLARWTAARGLSGCEYMIGVPGTVGGAIFQNAGANEQEMAQILESCRVFDFEDQKQKNLRAEECGLTYRSSKLMESSFLILSAVLRLSKSESSQIEAQVEKNLDYRKKSTPYAKPSLGSTFTRLKAKDGSWIYPGKLIEDSGLKGFRMGNVSMSSVHANYLVNEGGATFEEALRLIEKVEDEVYKKTGHQLEREIQVWSDWTSL